jgi:hypothetical protein
MKYAYAKGLFAAITIIGLVFQPALAATHRVKCDSGKTISKALETSAGSAERLELLVTGTCKEDVTIRRNSVTIAGDPGAAIDGTVRVFSSTAVWIENISITGAGGGVIVSGNANARLTSVEIRGNAGHGLTVRRNASIWLVDSKVFGNDGYGIFVEDGSFEATRSQIVDNYSYGIFADQGAHVILTDTEVAGNQAPGVQVMLHSTVDLRGVTSFHDNWWHALFAVEDSAIRISSPDVAVSGNIGCGDGESSFSNVGGGAVESTDCSDFD